MQNTGTATESRSARGRLTAEAYRFVRDAIMRGEFPEGSVLAEDELARTLGSSRTPVRHALGLLLKEGLVQVGPRRQLVVRGFTPEHRREIALLREALETVAIRQACAVMSDDDLDQLRVLVLRQRRTAAAGDQNAFLEHDEAFHLKIAEAANLPILYGVLSQLRGFVRVARVGLDRPPEALKKVAAEHDRIIDALEARDPEAAAAVLARHLEAT